MIDRLTAEYATLSLPRFAEAEALALGQIMLTLAEGMPVVINIRTADRTLFHAALPGATPLNDVWARRKSNVALAFHLPSLLVGQRHVEKGSLAMHGLNEAEYADHGGAVPIRVDGVGVVACATVSGLPQVEDHALVVRAVQVLQTKLRG
jgi:uncharacterized protein (UPF0303 family)